jgi:cellobiose transport system substrate-binding protein
MQRLRSAGKTLGVAVVAALALVACASGTNTNQSSEPVKLTLATFNKFGYSDEMLAQFHKLHPNITVVQNVAATSQAAQDNMFTKLAAGSGLGDVEAVEVDWMPKLRQYSSLFVDLSTGDTKSRWLDWKTQAATVNGKLIGAGTDIGPEAICYRSDAFAKAGLPSDPAAVSQLLKGDWSNYYTVGQQFSKANTGVAWFDSAGATFQGLANQYQNFFEANDGSVIATTNPDVKNAFVSVLNASSSSSAHLQEWSTDWNAGLANGAWATMLCPSWMLGVISGNGPKIKDWKIANVFPNGGGNWGGSYLTVPKQGKHTAEAKELALWLTAPEQQIAAFVTTGNYPSQVGAYSNPALTGAVNAYFNNAPIGQIFADRAKAVTVTPYKGVKYAAIMQAVQDGLTRVESKKQTIDASWAQVVNDIKALS